MGEDINDVCFCSVVCVSQISISLTIPAALFHQKPEKFSLNAGAGFEYIEVSIVIDATYIIPRTENALVE